MTQISVISKESHTLLNQVDSNNVSLTENSVVVIKVPKEDVASITRNGDNAMINLKNGETIVVENYFNTASSDNSLVFEGQDGSLYWAKFTDSTGAIADVIQYQPLAEIEPLLYKDSLTGVILPWALGAGGAGLIGAAASNGSDKKDEGTPAPTAPAKLSAFEVSDNQAPQVGKMAAGTATNDKTPVVSGSGAEAGAEIKIYDGAQLIASTTAKADGTWSVEVAQDLADGAHSITVSQTVNGVEGPKSDAFDFTVDTKNPNVSIDDLGETNVNQPVISGKTNEPKAEIDVVIKDGNGNVVDSGKGTVDSSGNWTYTPGATLPEGAYTVEVTAKDPAGNTSSVDKGGLVVDTTDPTVTIDPLKPTTDDTPTIGGTTDPNSVVDVVIKDKGGNIVDSGTGTVDGNGDWTYTPKNPLPEGEYEVEVKATDPAGNESTATGSGLDVDTTSPIVTIDPLKPSNNTAPAITGKTEQDATVTIQVKDHNGNVVDSGPATVDSAGNWTYTPAAALPEGAYTVEATAKDPAGNSGTAKDSGLSIDTTNPTISINPLSPTADTTPGFGGQTDKDATVTVRIKNASGTVVETGTAVVDNAGKWSYTAKTPLTDGNYTVEATAKDPAGNTANAQASGLIVDTALPTVTVDAQALTNDATPDITGTTDKGALVTVTVKNAAGQIVDSGAATVDSNGGWSYTAALLADGTYTVEAVAQNPAGNKASASANGLTVDTVPPAVTIEPLTLTKENIPVIKGTSEAGATVNVVVKDASGAEVATGTVSVDQNNEWTFTPAAKLADGAYSVVATAKDPAGNTSNAVTDSGLQVDTVPPTVDIDNLFGAAAARMLMSTSSATAATLPQTNQIKPTFSGSSTKSIEVMIYLQDEAGKMVDSGPAILDTATGRWSYTPSHDLAEGYYMLQAISKDAAGNQSQPAAKAFIIDIQEPIVEVEEIGLGNDATPDIKGKVNEPTSTVTVKVKDASGAVVETGTATVAADGKWTYTVKKILADGNYEVTASAKDKAGNISAEDTATAQIDTAAPSSTLTVSATGEVLITFSEPVKGFDTSDVTVQGGKLKELTLQPDGSWKGQVVADGTSGAVGTVTVAVADGAYTDLAGNNGKGASATDVSVPSVDTTAPTAVITIDANGAVTVSFSEAVKGFDPSDVKVTGGKLQSLTEQADGSWKGQVIADGATGASGKVDLNISAGSYTDLAGNAGTSATQSQNVPSIDSTGPTPTLTLDVNGNLSISFSEAVKGFDASDVKVAGGKIISLMPQADGSWTGVVVASGSTGASSNVVVSIDAGTYTDLAGNAGLSGFAVAELHSLDTTAPTAQMTLDANGNLVIKFSEAVKGFDVSDLTVTNGSLSNLVEQADGSWTAKITPNSNTGAPEQVTVILADQSYEDLAGNKGVATQVQQSLQTVDTLAPVIDGLKVQPNTDGTATVTGKTEAGATVTVKDPNGKDVPVTVHPDGTFTATVPAPAPEGTYNASATDKAGNTGTAQDTLVDKVAPVVTVDVVANPDGTATVTGKTEAGATVTLKDPSGKDVPVTVNPDGSYTATVPAPAAEGAYTASAKDKAGNIGTGADTLVDKVAPVVTVDVVANPDGTATVTGKTEAGATVTLKDPSGKDVPVTVNSDGSYTATVPAPAAEGTYTASAKDKAGNIGTGSDTLVDKVAPVVTVDVVANPDGTATVTGKTEAGATVTLKDPSGKDVPVTVNPDGSYTATVPAPAAEGTYTASATDKAGNTGTAQDTLVDKVAPVVTVDVVANPDGTATVTGKTEAGATVTLKDPSGKDVPVTVNPDGSYTATVPAPAAEGTYTASATDKAGNTGTAQDTLVDKVAPVVTVDVVANPDGTATVTGKTEAGATVTLKDPSGKDVPVTVNPDGSYTATVPAPAAEGAYTASAKDKAGNIGTGSDTLVDKVAPVVTVDVVANPDGTATVTGKTEAGATVTLKDPSGKDVPVTVNPDGSYTATVPAPAAEGTYTASAKDKAGNIGTGSDILVDKVAPTVSLDVQPNTDGTATVTGKTEAGATVTVKDPNGKDVPVTVNPDGSYTATVPAPAAEGTYTASAKDKAGNIGTGTDVLDDNIGPSVNLSFDVNGNLIINFSEPVTGFDISDIKIVGGSAVGLTKVSDTQWTAQIKGDTNAAVQYLEVSIADNSYTDIAGNFGLGSVVKGNITLPTVDIDDIFGTASFAAPAMLFAARTLTAVLPPATNNPLQTFSGTSTKSVEVKVNIYDSTNTLLDSGLAKLDSLTGKWTYTPSKALPDGLLTLEAIGIDASGVQSAPSYKEFIIDTVKPDIDIDQAGLTTDATPSFGGKTEAGATVTVTIKDKAGNVVETGTAVVDFNGEWNYTAKSTADGSYTVEATAKDRAGNISDKAATSLIVDTVSQLDGLTVTANPDGTATVTGKTEVGATVTVKDPNGKDVPVTVNPDGTFTATVPAPAAEGTYTVTATDKAGNAGTATADLDDHVAPTVDGLTVTANSDGTATVTGKTEAGATVTVEDPNGKDVPVMVNPDGTFTATVPAPAAEGTYTVTATDKAGNAGTATADLDDHVAPTVDALIVTANPDGTATVTGKTEVGAAVTVKDPNGKDVPVTVNPDGTFTATVPAPAAEGSYKATATDKAGNAGTATADLDDHVAPKIDGFNVDSQADGTATISGKTEAGATVTVKDPNGKDVPVTVNPDGSFTATVPAPAAEGTYQATATDKAGNNGYAQDDLIDTTVPSILTAEVNQADGATVFGQAQAGADITVYKADGKTVLGQGKADSSGQYSVHLNPAQVDGEKVKVTAKDPGGESAPISAAAPDLYAPDAPIAQVSADGKAVTGTTEPNADITVYGGSKGTTVIATAKADANGNYSAALNPALVDGEDVKVTAKDPGGESSATQAQAPDLYAPNAPTAVFNSTGNTISGDAEANSVIKVYAPDGVTVIAQGASDANGKYSIKLPSAYNDGQTLLVSAKDGGGESGKTGAKAPSVQLDAADNLVSAGINFEYPVTDTRSAKLFSDFSLANIGTKTYTGYFTVGDQELGKAIISVSTGSLLNLFDSAQMKLYAQNADGSWKLIGGNKDVGLLDLLGIFGESTKVVANNLQTGNYKFEFTGGSLIGFMTSINASLDLSISSTTSTPVVSSVTEARGNVVTDNDSIYGKDNVPAGTQVTAVNGQSLNATGSTVIAGDHGVLTIAKDGTYSYKPNSAVSNIGKADVFSYTVTDPSTGKTSTADLTIHINTQSELSLKWNTAHPADDATTVVATDNSNTISFDASNAISTAKASAISYSWLFGVGNTKTGSSKFTVADGTFEDVKISFGSTQVASLLGGTVINVYDKANKLVATTSASTLIDVITLLPNGNSLSISGLKAGEYTIKAVTNTGLSFAGSVNATISRTITDLDDFTAKSTGTTAKGNIFTDNNGSGTDVLASNYTGLYISKDGGVTYTAVNKAGITVQGDHGQLTIKSDGSYSYTVTDGKAVTGQVEDFSYKLVAPNGDTSIASLTISSGLNYTGSVGDDKITSSSGNDTVTSKVGADTLIFKVLNNSDAAGGNGHDTWNDFKKAEGDKIDVSALLQGKNVDKSNIGEFISVSADGKGNTIISIDRDGTAGKAFNKVELLTLKNTDIGLQELLDNNHLVY